MNKPNSKPARRARATEKPKLNIVPTTTPPEVTAPEPPRAGIMMSDIQAQAQPGMTAADVETAREVQHGAGQAGRADSQLRVRAGAAGSPVEEYIEGRLDLNRMIIKRPTATFFVRVAGHTMTGADIHPGDILVVDRSLDPMPGRIGIIVINGELTVRRFALRDDHLYLAADSPDHADILADDAPQWECWGIVTYAVRHFG